MASKIKVDQIQTGDGTGTIALQNQLSGMTSVSMPTGSVLQVVQGLYTNNFNTTSTSYVDTGLSASITPSSTSSKILVMVSQQGFKAGSSDTYYYNILRGSTQIGETRVQIQTTSQSSAGNYLHRLDSPSTTSSITYKTQVHSDSGNIIYFQWSTEGSAAITLMEIAG